MTLSGTPVIQVAGLAQILIDTGASHALQILGYTEDGANTIDEAYFLDIPCDDNGGTAGPPADLQMMGNTHEIRLMFSKFDMSVGAGVYSRIWGGTDGAPPSPGDLMLSNGNFFRLVINSTNNPLNYPCVVFRRPIELGKGTKYSRWTLTGTAYKCPANHPITSFQGILFNTNISQETWSEW